jgi:hypothetical protein
MRPRGDFKGKVEFCVESCIQRIENEMEGMTPSQKRDVLLLLYRWARDGVDKIEKEHDL